MSFIRRFFSSHQPQPQMPIAVDVECEICDTAVPQSDLLVFSSKCKHPATWCRGCIQKTLNEELFGKLFTPKINCQYTGCNCAIEYDDVRIRASKADFERYDSMLLKVALEQDPNFRRCLNANCGSGVIHTGGTDTPIVVCCSASCKALSCFTHNVPWHHGETCDQYAIRMAQSDNAASEELIKAITRKCPKCNVNIQKNGGCDHMTCKSCKHEFCFVCSADYNRIRKDGCKSHNAGCKYYA